MKFFMVKKTFSIKGMHCNSCVNRIEEELRGKVDSVKVNLADEKAVVEFHSGKISEKQIREIVKDCGYECFCDSEENIVDIKTGKKTDLIGLGVMIGSFVFLGVVLYLLLQSFGIDLEIPTVGEGGSLLLLFFVGILTGFHCIAMCGGFVVSYTTKNALKGHKSFKQHLVYGGAKVFSYAVIGGVFGLIGGIVAFSVGLRGWVAIIAGIFMIFYALGMFGIKWFRKFQVNPKFLMRFTSRTSRKAKGPFFAPLVTGLLSGLFIACGPLQAMYLFAAGSGSFFNGLTSLAAFGLGTLPVMLGFGSIATVISHKTTKKILKVGAIIVLILGIIILNRGLTVMGSAYSYDSIKAQIMGVDSQGVIFEEDYQVVNMEVNRYGWEPNSFVLKKGVPVKWNIEVKELTGCNNEIIVRDYDIDVKLKKGIQIVEFVPDKVGTIRWSCWMGMIPGSFIVTEDGQASDSQVKQAAPIASGGCSGGAGGGSCGSASCGSTTGGSCGCGG